MPATLGALDGFFDGAGEFAKATFDENLIEPGDQEGGKDSLMLGLLAEHQALLGKLLGLFEAGADGGLPDARRNGVSQGY